MLESSLTPSVEDVFIQRESYKQLLAALATLDPDESLLLRLRYQQNMPIEKVAREAFYGIPLVAVRMMEEVALKKLREALDAS